MVLFVGCSVAAERIRVLRLSPHKRRRPVGLAKPKASLERQTAAHHIPGMKKAVLLASQQLRGRSLSGPLFDIVNGFFNRCRGDMVRFLRSSDQEAEQRRTQMIIWLS